MPNRILKENIRTSSKLNAVSDGAFRFWAYLLTYVDDYGRGSADPDILKGFVFPKQRDKTADDVAALLGELERAQLVTCYTVENEAYLCIPDWDKHQTIRSKRSKFPAPESTCTHMHADAPVIRIQSESESISGSEPENNAPAAQGARPQTETEDAEESVVRQFNAICTDLPHVQKLHAGRRQAIRAVQDQVASYGGWEQLFRTVQESDFLSGRSGQWQGCGFDWLLTPANLQKVAEGNYRNRASPQPPASYDIDEMERRLLYGPIVLKEHA